MHICIMMVDRATSIRADYAFFHIPSAEIADVDYTVVQGFFQNF